MMPSITCRIPRCPGANKYHRQSEIANLDYQIQQANDFEREEPVCRQVISQEEFENDKREYLGLKRQLDLTRTTAPRFYFARRSEKANQCIIARMQNNLTLLRNLKKLNIKSPTDGKLSSFNARLVRTNKPDSV